MLLKVQCEKCKTKYKLDEARIQGKGAKITCPRCRHVFVVMKDAARVDTGEEDASDLQEESTVNIPVTAPAGGTASGGPVSPPSISSTPTLSSAAGAGGGGDVPHVPRPTNVDSLSWKEVGLTTFKVKVAIGLVYDFSDVGTLKKYIAEKRVVSTDRVSFDGKTWYVLKDVGGLDEFFIEQWMTLKREKLLEDQRSVPKGPTGPVFGEPKREGKPTPTGARSTSPAGGEPAKAERADPGSVKTPWSADAGREGGQSKGLLGQDLFDDIAGEDAVPPPPLTTARRADEAAPVRRTPEPVAPSIGTPIPGTLGSSSAQTSGRRVSAFEGLILVLLLGVSGYLGWRYSAEASAASSPMNADPQAGMPELEALMQKSFPVAYAASQQAPAPAAAPDPGVNPRSEGDRGAPERLEKKEPAERGERHSKEEGARVEHKSGKGTISVAAIKPEDLYQLGQASLKQHDYDGAIESLRTAVEMQPRNDQFQYALGYALFLGGKLGEAESAFQKTLSLKPGRTEAHKWLGEIYARQGNKEQALKQWKTYVEGNPPDAAVIQKKIEKLSNS